MWHLDDWSNLAPSEEATSNHMPRPMVEMRTSSAENNAAFVGNDAVKKHATAEMAATLPEKKAALLDAHEKLAALEAKIEAATARERKITENEKKARDQLIAVSTRRRRAFESEIGNFTNVKVRDIGAISQSETLKGGQYESEIRDHLTHTEST